MEDAREWEANLRESAGSADGLKFGCLNRRAGAIRGVSQDWVFNCSDATERDGPSTFGNAIRAEGIAQRAQVGVDIVELAGEEESHVVSAIELGDECYPWGGQLNLSGIDVLRVAHLRAGGKELQQGACP